MRTIPKAVANRLSLYRRLLERLHADGVRTISSRAISDSLGLKDAQVRRDLAHFGSFGQPGLGYRVAELLGKVRTILGTDRTWPVALVGYGNLGRALVAYAKVPGRSFRIAAVFDADPAKVGRQAGGLVVRDASELVRQVRRQKIPLAILAVPAEVAPKVAWRLARAGVRGILNFAPARLDVPKRVFVSDIDFTASMEQLSFHLRRRRA